jgi:TetR/AcrR family fatty acid metabolism transcriptional regulator
MIHIMFSGVRGENVVSVPLPPTPQQERGKEKRRRVYEAAMRAFATNGFEQARIEDVVTEAGVSWGTFFRYFPRKEDVLLEAMAEHYRTRVRRAAESALERADAGVREAVYAMLVAMLTSEWPSHLHGAVLREVTSTPVRFAALLGPDEKPWFVVVAELMAIGQERGEVRADVDPLTLSAVVGAGSLFPAIQGGFEDLLGLRGLPGTGHPIAILDRAFPVAWRAVEPG